MSCDGAKIETPFFNVKHRKAGEEQAKDNNQREEEEAKREMLGGRTGVLPLTANKRGLRLGRETLAIRGKSEVHLSWGGQSAGRAEAVQGGKRGPAPASLVC